ncbi:unnamed protein product [Diamesa hyperborea]
MDIKIALLYFVCFEVIQAQNHNHHNGISEDQYHHHSETLSLHQIVQLIAALEKDLDLKLEPESRKSNKRIFFKDRKEEGAPDIWEAIRREKKRNTKLHTRSRLM